MDQASILTLINLSKDIAQLNLGYLGISVAILGVLGGVFVYFNINPLKNTLNKQEKKIEDLKNEANNLLIQSKEQSEIALTEFEKKQSDFITAALKQQKKEIDLEIKNKIQEAYGLLLNKIEEISENKDSKLKEITMAEVKNNLLDLEKSITLSVNVVKEEFSKEIDQVNSSIRKQIKDLDEGLKEMKIYKYSKEGQMGAIIYSIELLESAVDDYFELKQKLGDFDDNIKNSFGWKIQSRLTGLIKEIGDLPLGEEYVRKIGLQITRIAKEGIFDDLIGKINEKISL